MGICLLPTATHTTPPRLSKHHSHLLKMSLRKPCSEVHILTAQTRGFGQRVLQGRSRRSRRMLLQSTAPRHYGKTLRQDTAARHYAKALWQWSFSGGSHSKTLRQGAAIRHCGKALRKRTMESTAVRCCYKALRQGTMACNAARRR